MKQILKFIRFKKISALFVSCAMLTAMLPSDIYAHQGKSFDNVFSDENIVKQNYGKISSYSDAGSNITVVNIQDFHCHFQTQKNISRIIKDLSDKFNVTAVFAEGGYENINAEWIDLIKDPSFKDIVMEKMLAEGNITGAEYYVMKNGKNDIFKGIDDSVIHSENLSRLSDIIAKKQIYSDVVSKISSEISVLKKRYVNERNNKFTRLTDKYNSGKIDSAKFYRILLKYADKINKYPGKYNNLFTINTDKYKNILSYINISKNSFNVNAKKLTYELHNIIAFIKNNVPYASYKKLVSSTDNFADTVQLCRFLSVFAKELNIDITSDFPELNKFIMLSAQNENFNPVELVKEEKALCDEITMALSYDNTEYEISYILDFFAYFKNYLNYSLTTYEWKYFTDNFDRFKNLYSKYSAVNRIKSIEGDFAEINKYYDTNNLRNDIFVSNILKNTGDISVKNIRARDAKEILSGSDKVIIAVTGGFHSEDLKNLFVRNRINTVVITPNVTDSENRAKEKYEQIIKEQSRFLSQALAFRLVSSSSASDQKKLLIKTALNLLGDNNISELSKYFGTDIKITKTDKNTYHVKYDSIDEEIEFDTDESKNILPAEKIISDAVSCSFEKIKDAVPYEGLKSIFNPDLYEILKDMSVKLFEAGIYFSDGAVYEIENSAYNGQAFDGIEPECYSAFLPEIQHMLLKRAINMSGKTEELFYENAEGDLYGDMSDEEYDNRERFNESSFARKYFFVPSIASKMHTIDLYRTIYDRSLHITAKIFSGRDKYYDYIKRNVKNSHRLLDISSDSQKDLRYRLTAFMYLVNYAPNDFLFENSEKISKIRNRLKTEFVSDIQNGQNFKINVSSDLRAAAAGFVLTLNIPEKTEMSLLKKISKAVLHNQYKKFISDTDISILYSVGNPDTALRTRLLYFADLKNNVSKSILDKYSKSVYYAESALKEEFSDNIKNGDLFEIGNDRGLRAFITGCILSAGEDVFSGDQKEIMLKEFTKSVINYDYITDAVSRIKKADKKRIRALKQLDKITGVQKKEQLKANAEKRISETDRKAAARLKKTNDENRKKQILKDAEIKKQKIKNRLEKDIAKTEKSLQSEKIKNKINLLQQKTEKIKSEAEKAKTYPAKKLYSLLDDRTVDLKYRLLALMYLNDSGLFQPGSNDTSAYEKAITEEFTENIKSGKIFEVNNNLDLRALATGVTLTISEALNFEKITKFLLLNIVLKSVLVKENKKSDTIANSRMSFVATDPLTVAHEIGHLILYFYEFRAKNKETTSIHELFADVIANVFGARVGQKKIYDTEILYSLFVNNVNYNKVFQEEHSAARGFLRVIDYLLNDVVEDRVAVWTTLKDVILEYILQEAYLSGKGKQKSQGIIFRDIFGRFFDKINADPDKLALSGFMSEIIFQSVSYDIIKEFADTDKEGFIDIARILGGGLKENKSYKTLPEKNKSYTDIEHKLNSTSSVTDIDNFIFSNIISNPEQVKTVLEEIRLYIIDNGEFDFDCFKILTEIELVLNNSFINAVAAEIADSDSQATYDAVFRDKVKTELKPFGRHMWYTLAEYKALKRNLKRKYNGSRQNLSMDWLEKTLKIFGIKDRKKQQKIIVAVEYPFIILGMFFPAVRNLFLAGHSKNIEKKLGKLESATASEIEKISGVSVDEIKNMPFAGRMTNIIKILSDKSVKLFNKSEHLIANGIYVDRKKIRNQMEEINEKNKKVKAVSILRNTIFMTVSACVLIIGFMHFSPVTFIFMIFPVNSFIFGLLSLLPVFDNKIYGNEKYESFYYSNIPEEDYDYSDGSGLSVTVQIPVYKEENKIIFRTIMQSMEACKSYTEKSQKQANVLVSDDGLAPMLGKYFSEEGIAELMAMPYENLSDMQKQAVERIKFYREHNISFVARPAEKRAGRFKKASNLNHTYKVTDNIKNNNENKIDDGTVYEGQGLYIGDVILMLDKDSELHKDVISVTIPKFIKDSKLAFTQNSTAPSNYSDNYFSKFTAVFTTFLYKQVFSQSAISGGLVPFVGHNGFIRTAYLDEIDRWPENRVSEDYYTSTRFFSKGYHGKYLAFDNYEFKEMVSRSYLEEFSKISRYVFGLLELIFNKKETGEQEKGILTDWFKDLMTSKHVTLSQKINFFVYPLSYVNIIFIIPAALAGLVVNPVAAAPQLMKFVLMSVPFVVELYKSHKKTKGAGSGSKNFIGTCFELAGDILSVSLMFISFSYGMIKSMLKFVFKYKDAGFGATNVDDDNYSLKEAFGNLKSHFSENKSAFLLFIPVILITAVLKPELNIVYLSTLFYIFSFFIASVVLSPFFTHSVKETVSGWFKGTVKNININYESYNNFDAVPQYDTKVNTEHIVRIFISSNTDVFEKKDLINTGLKIKGNVIWLVKNDGNLIFAADGADAFETAKAVNKSRILNKRLRKILKLKKNINLNIQTSVFSDKNTEDIYIEDGIAVVKSYEFTEAVNKILNTLSVSYAQKTVISLASVADDKLYDALSNGKARKTVTEKQFESIRRNLAADNKDIISEISELKKKGIEIYIITDNKDADFSSYGISGHISGNEMYDYYLDETIETEAVTDKMSAKEFEHKIMYSAKPLIVELSVLQKILSGNNILDTYSVFDTLIGNIKIKFGLKNISLNDIRRFAYNIDLADIPEAEDYEINGVLSSDINNFFNRVSVKQNNIAGIILGDTKISAENKSAFLEVIKERIYMKNKLKKYGKEGGLSDKNTEIMLGRLLKMQLSYADKTSVLPELDRFKGSQNDMIAKLGELKNKISEEKPAVLNTMIELILAYADENRTKDKIMTTEVNVNDYKKMLAAA